MPEATMTATATLDRIPLVDLPWQHAQIEAELLPQLTDRMRRGAFILGDDVVTFEHALATFTGRDHCVGVANGTDAIELALQASGVGPGDEVLVPANTFIATAAAVIRTGAQPRLVDCDPLYHLIDPAGLRGAITGRTRAVIPVHLFGQIAPMEAIMRIARDHELTVIEDAAQAVGAERNDSGIGTWGSAAATSFYPGKNLGAYGDAGAVLTSDMDIAAKVRLLHDHGSLEKYRHLIAGVNSRLDALQAIVLSVKLARLNDWNQMRREAAGRYDTLLAGDDRVVTPRVMDGNVHVWHLYVVRIPDRDATVGRMQAAGVEAGIHYPIPLHLQPALQTLGGHAGDFPHAEAAADEILSLPIHPGITPAQQERVVATLAASLP